MKPRKAIDPVLREAIATDANRPTRATVTLTERPEADVAAQEVRIDRVLANASARSGAPPHKVTRFPRIGSFALEGPAGLVQAVLDEPDVASAMANEQPEDLAIQPKETPRMAAFDKKDLGALGRRYADEDEGASLARTHFDKSLWPDLSFPSTPFAISGADLAVGPESSCRMVTKAVRSATKEILFYIYDATAQYLIDELAKRKKAGVKIRAMYDGNGSAVVEEKALKAACTRVKRAPSSAERPAFTVCHQKFLVIDGKRVVVESCNWTKSGMPDLAPGKWKKGNREWLMRVDDAAVAAWYKKLFEADWKIPESAIAAGGEVTVVMAEDVMLAASKKPAKMFDTESVPDGAATLMPIVSPDNYLSEVKKLLKGAKTSIDIQQQYYQAGKGVNDLLEVISDRRAAGVKVRLMSSAAFAKAWERTVETLEAAGLGDCLRSIDLSVFGHLHNKGILVDRKVAVVTSTNWSENSITRAREAGAILRSPAIAAWFGKVFDFDWDKGTPADEVDAGLGVISGSEAVIL